MTIDRSRRRQVPRMGPLAAVAVAGSLAILLAVPPAPAQAHG